MSLQRRAYRLDSSHREPLITAALDTILVLGSKIGDSLLKPIQYVHLSVPSSSDIFSVNTYLQSSVGKSLLIEPIPEWRRLDHLTVHNGWYLNEVPLSLFRSQCSQ